MSPVLLEGSPGASTAWGMCQEDSPSFSEAQEEEEDVLQNGAALGTARGTGQDGSCCQGWLQGLKLGLQPGLPGLSCRAAPAALRALGQPRACATCQGQLSACLAAPHAWCRGAGGAGSDSCQGRSCCVERVLCGIGLLRAPAHDQVISEGTFHKLIQGKDFLLESVLS